MKLTKLEVLNKEVKELFGDDFKIYKDLTNANIVKVINPNGGHRTVAYFSKLKELETFITQYKNLKYHGIN